MSKLNPKTLTIAAALLMVLALLAMATPLLRTAGGFAGRGGIRQFGTQGGGATGQGGQGITFQGTPFPQVDGTTPQGQPNFPGSSTRQFQTGPGGGIGLLSLGFLGGVTGTIVYLIALLVSLAAAVGMFMLKGWGKVLGIIMAVLYGLVALVSLVPTLLVSLAFRFGNYLTIGLDVVRLLLAIAVIVFASIRVRQAAAPVEPAASA